MPKYFQFVGNVWIFTFYLFCFVLYIISLIHCLFLCICCIFICLYIYIFGIQPFSFSYTKFIGFKNLQLFVQIFWGFTRLLIGLHALGANPSPLVPRSLPTPLGDDRDQRYGTDHAVVQSTHVRGGNHPDHRKHALRPSRIRTALAALTPEYRTFN